MTAVIGLRAKSARAVAVILRGSADSPLAVRRVELTYATAERPAISQPYHAVMDLPWERAQEEVKKAEAVLVSAAASALRTLLADGGERERVGRVGIVGAPDRQLEKIASPHVRAHAAEGVLFRRILERAAEENGASWTSYPEKGLEERATRDLGSTPEALKAKLAEFGRAVGRPWRADEKAAALAAWLALVEEEK